MVSMGCVLLGMLGCEDRMDSPAPSAGEGKPVEVTLHVGIADEVDAATRGGGSADTKAAGAGDQSGFDVRLLPVSGTKAVLVTDDPLATAKPDKLYGLQILQYTSGSDDSAPIGFINVGDQAIGTSFTGTLSDNNGNDCQLLIIARGSGGTVSSLQGKTLEAIRKMAVSSTTIDGIRTAEGIKAMPYLLHLPKVKVVNDNGTYKIQSPDGVDVRLLLRRLATRVTVAWENLSATYPLQQVLLLGIPVDYSLLPPAGENATYPSILAQYTKKEVPDVSDAGQYTCWVPSVVRGESGNATSDYYRTKANAPKGSVYATFISQHSTDSKKKLDFRVYLGGSKSREFNLLPNTNYIYKVTLPAEMPSGDDKRITIIDPILASENNSNLVPTANCFMVAPGGAFCFNPYTYYVNGAPTENTLLQEWCGNTGGTLSTPIKSVKVLWQTLEDGDLGDPTLGIVNNYDPGTAADDHTNIVELKNGGSLTDARIYCRVAPNTTGGSGVIAAYSGADGTGDILWSWHVWVTNYAPSASGRQTVLEENKRKFVLTNGSGITQLPLMDRNLGAYDGYVAVPGSIQEMSRTGGFYYQHGRKDPFPGAYTAEKLENVYSIVLNKTTPPKHWQNRYLPDGFSWLIPKSIDNCSLRDAYKEPRFLATGSNQGWCSDSPKPAWGATKTPHDPCPAGWRVPSKDELNILTTWNKSVPSTAESDGGMLLRYDTDPDHLTYVRFTGYPPKATQLNDVGFSGFMATFNSNNNTRDVFTIGWGGGVIVMSAKIGFLSMATYDAHALRCIQER